MKATNTEHIAINGNQVIKNNQDILARMTKCENIMDSYNGDFAKIDINFMDTVISLYYDGTMTEEEKENIRKDIEKLNASILRRKKLLSNENYTSKAPSHVVENERRK